MGHVKAARFVIAKALFDVHAFTVLDQARATSGTVRDDGQQFRFVFAITLGPGQREVRDEFARLGQLYLLKVATSAGFDLEVVNATAATIF